MVLLSLNLNLTNMPKDTLKHMGHTDNNDEVDYDNHVGHDPLRDTRLDTHLCHLGWIDILDHLGQVDNTYGVSTEVIRYKNM